MINLEILGKFYDNHSLSLINRQLAVHLNSCSDFNVFLTPLDNINPNCNVDVSTVKLIKKLANKEEKVIDVQLRHSYPPIWNWPTDKNTKVVYIQPWEYPKMLFEWQYRFENFADMLCVPSNYERDVFVTGGMNPDNIITVANGYDDAVFNHEPLEPYTDRIDPKKYNFVFVGNGQWRKGIDILLNAWKDAIKKYDNCALIIKDNPQIYGVNNLLNEIIKLQYKTQCGEIIYIDDQLSDLQMASIYKNSKFLIHPYRAEGFGMHVQEAVACGCYPLLPDVGPHNDFIPEEAGLRFQTNAIPINLTDQQYFALKPGDSTTMMSTHTFAHEPVTEDVKNKIGGIYHHHQKNKLIDDIKNVKLENTWKNVCKKYEEVLKNVSEYTRPRRFS